MGDCGSFSLDLEGLTCTGDVRAWTTALLAREQAAIDHMIACINNVDLPECDPCALASDFVNCPLPAVALDLENVTYGDEPGVGILPYPERTGEFEFRSGLKQSGCVPGEGWLLDTVLFGTPFPSGCDWVGVSIDKAQDSDCGGVAGGGANVMKIHAPEVRSLSATGFSVYFCGDDFGAKRKLTYRYLAAGH